MYVWDLFLYFIIYSVMGYLLETVYAYVRCHRYMVKRTMLHLPMCPVYGVGAVAMLLLPQEMKLSPSLMFCGGFFVCSLVEYVYALVSERVFGVRWWDYSQMRGNIQGRICPAYSLAWGLVTIFFLKWMHPYFESLVGTLTVYGKILFCSIFASLFFSDLAQTCHELLKLARGKQSDIRRILPEIKVIYTEKT